LAQQLAGSGFVLVENNSAFEPAKKKILTDLPCATVLHIYPQELIAIGFEL